MINWIHKILNPHCTECRDELKEDNVYREVIDQLKMQLAIANAEKSKLLDALLEKNTANVGIEIPKAPNLEKVGPKLVTWDIRRRMLEAEDKIKAQLIAKKAKETEALEKEVGISKESNIVEEEKVNVESIS